MNYKFIKFLIVVSMTFLFISCNNTDNAKKGIEKSVKKEVKEKVENVKKDTTEKNKNLEKEVAKAKAELSKKKEGVKYTILTDETVLGSYNGTGVKLKDVKSKYKGELNKFYQKDILEKYNREQLKVTTYAQELILLDAAKSKGFKTSKELLESITKNVAEPSKEDIDSFIEKYKSQLKGMDDTKIREIAIRSLKDKLKTDIVEKFVNNLIKTKNLKITFPYPSNIPELKIDIKGSPFKGKEDAKYTIVEYSDFQCPYCSRIAPEVKKAIKNNPDVKLVFKHFPLPFHPVAFNGAVASVCANQQGKFWEFHDMIFKNQKTISDENLIKYAKDLKLDMKAFDICYKSPAATAFVKNDMKIAEKLGINGTPSLFLNGVKIEAMNEAMITKKIEELKNRVVGNLTNDTVVISYDDKKITWGDFNKANPYFKILNERKKIEKEHEFYFKLFSRYLSEKMLADEAKATGAKDVNEYMKKQLATITPATEDELKKLYEQLKPRLGGKTFKEVKIQLAGYSQQMKQQQFTQKEMSRLADKYKVKLEMAKPYLPALHIPTENAPFIGNKTAKNVLIIFSEFQCPYCGKFAEFSKKLAEKFPNKLKIVFKHFPLSFHDKAMDASIAAQCAFKQNKFEAYHNLLFENQSQFSSKTFNKDMFVKWAKDLKLNEADFKKCIQKKDTKNYIESVIKEGMSLDVQGTPTLFLNGQPLQLKAYSVEAFEKYLK